MFEFRGLVASATKNENAGFVTPQNKNVTRKALFTEPKMAFGDLKKNVPNVITPMKNGTVEKQLSPLLPSTSVFEEATNSTPKANDNSFGYNIDELDIWNRKQMLSEHQFDFLFINSPMTSPIRPATPPSPIIPESPLPMPDARGYWSDDGSSLDPFFEDDYYLPAIDNSFSDDNLGDGHVNN